MKVKHLCLIIVSIMCSITIINKSNAELIEYSLWSTPNTQSTQTQEYNTTNQVHFSDDYQTVNVKHPITLGYKSKAEVFAIRKAAVNESIFKNPAYTPSDEVFGQIEDGKPWISLNGCTNMEDGKSPITGESEESRFILNPSALVMLNYPFGAWCNQGEHSPHIVPKEIKYAPEKKEIVVIYDRLNKHTLTNNAYFELCGINARDLGYKYIYVDKSKSTYDLQFVNSDNVGSSVTEFQDFLHTGGSCGHESGCNNGSPNQPMLQFENSHQAGTQYKKNKEIYIKLWKNRPSSPYQEADMVERIIIENA